LTDRNGADEAVLDTLAELLRALGEHAFDVGEIDATAARRDFEAWARHALVGASPPGGSPGEESGADRDWPALRRFVSDHRRGESEAVRTSLRDLRETIWIFVQGMGRALPAERAADASVAAEISKLRDALDGGDTRAIRDSAAAAIERVEEAAHERQESDRQQLGLVAARVDQLARELMAARESFSLDEQTGLYDSDALAEVLERLVHLAMLSGRLSTLFVVDIDDFKWVIDRFGTEAGDVVLAEVARCLDRGFNRRGDFVARAGPDELAVVAQTDSAQVDASLGEHVLDAVRDLEVPHGEERIRVSVSMGIARLAPGESADGWQTRAADRLRAAKEAGRDRLVGDATP